MTDGLSRTFVCGWLFPLILLGWVRIAAGSFSLAYGVFFILLPSSSGVIGVVRPDLLGLALACDGGVRGRVSFPVVAPGSPLLALDDG